MIKIKKNNFVGFFYNEVCLYRKKRKECIQRRIMFFNENKKDFEIITQKCYPKIQESQVCF